MNRLSGSSSVSEKLHPADQLTGKCLYCFVVETKPYERKI